ncbi:endo-1,4-beta-xylanase [Nesterenkonia sp. CL21]|uniref:endo-1,4-beta-xylanase n=1 Tax=Nesterenkonia sp. CL21 TaxID=3064894 RepID=UPI00287A8EE1|nr:endo-1,4-beta-xylanase [Nesterenkonia sp. CL21]MDS2172301.1 endo-1,4-beta-xylanase [Nesterenkonia sp. CL21]
MTSLFTPPAPGRTPDPNLAHRRAQVTVTLTRDDGAPLAGRDVTARQTSQSFGFGCIGFELLDHITGESQDPDYDAGLAEHWLGVFNRATLPFYWGMFEPERGRPRTERLLAGARWFVERGIEVKGHPLVWHTVTAPWLLDLEVDEIERVQRDRIRRDVSEFAGLIDTWDAINEVVIMPVFTAEDNGITRLAHERGRIEMMRLAFDEARAANPDATLLLNDFDMSTAYECLIEGALEAGIRIDRLGLQSHMHQGAWGEDRTLEVLDRFSRFGIPIHFTENTILSGDLMPSHIRDLNDWQVDHWPTSEEGEARQAEELEQHYRTLYSHPSVESITYWGLPDRGMWLGAPGGLLRPDGSPKPAYHRLKRLVTEDWRTPEATLRTDDDGRLQFEGFLGRHELTVGGATALLDVDAPGEVTAEVVVG